MFMFLESIFKNWYILHAHFFTISKININKDIAPTCSADPSVHPPKTLPSFSAATFAKKIRKNVELESELVPKSADLERIFGF